MKKGYLIILFVFTLAFVQAQTEPYISGHWNDMEYHLGLLGDTIPSQRYVVSYIDGQEGRLVFFDVKGYHNIFTEHSITMSAEICDQCNGVELGNDKKTKLIKCEFYVPNEDEPFKEMEFPYVFLKDELFARGEIFDSNNKLIDQRIHLLLSLQKGNDIFLKIGNGQVSIKIKSENFWNKTNMKEDK